MALKTKKSVKGRPRMKRAARRGQRRAGVAERASIKETNVFALMSTNRAYNNYNIQLPSFTRAKNVAESYQYYRIKKVTYKFSPLFDTFASGSNSSVPHLYFMIDRLKQLQSANDVATWRHVGCKPRRLDEKILSWSFRPSVMVGTFDGAPPAGQITTQFSQYKISPWLATRDFETVSLWNPDSTDHLGCAWYVENSGGAELPYKVERIVEFEFKKPSYTVTAIPTLPPATEVEDLVADLA